MGSNPRIHPRARERLGIVVEPAGRPIAVKLQIGDEAGRRCAIQCRYIAAGDAMKLTATLIALGSVISTGHTWAQDVPLTAEEFQSIIVGKAVRWNLDDGKTYELELAQGGKATVSGPYNDVGKWRGYGPAGYCTSWNKQPQSEACVTVVRRDGALTVLRPDGSRRGTAVSEK